MCEVLRKPYGLPCPKLFAIPQRLLVLFTIEPNNHGLRWLVEVDASTDETNALAKGNS